MKKKKLKKIVEQIVDAKLKESDQAATPQTPDSHTQSEPDSLDGESDLQLLSAGNHPQYDSRAGA
jgi:hypothetical protein